jgi:hypothetical protein
MIGLFDSTNLDVSPEGVLPQGQVSGGHFYPASFGCAPTPCTKRARRPGGKAEPATVLTPIQSAATTLRRSALVLVARLRRLLNSWVAAAIAYREQQVALFAQRQLDDRNLDKTRIYRGPLDAGAARLRKR